MILRPWVAASLAGAAVALATPAAGVTAQAPARPASGPAWLRTGDWDHDRGGSLRDCYSARRVVLIDGTFRAILKNGRHGPEAIVLQGDSSTATAPPAAPWSAFTVSTYLDVSYPTQTENQYELEIRDFFKVQPLFVVKAFARHEQVFPFPVAHCDDDRDGNDQEHWGKDDGGPGGFGELAAPLGGPTAEGSGASGSPSPQAGDQQQSGQPGPGTSGGTTSSLSTGTTADSKNAGLRSTTRVGIVAAGMLALAGTLGAAWYRRRRSTR